MTTPNRRLRTVALLQTEENNPRKRRFRPGTLHPKTLERYNQDRKVIYAPKKEANPLWERLDRDDGHTMSDPSTPIYPDPKTREERTVRFLSHRIVNALPQNTHPPSCVSDGGTKGELKLRQLRPNVDIVEVVAARSLADMGVDEPEPVTVSTFIAASDAIFAKMDEEKRRLSDGSDTNIDHLEGVSLSPRISTSSRGLST